jgi:RNA polymerase primary sigma factor
MEGTDDRFLASFCSEIRQVRNFSSSEEKATWRKIEISNKKRGLGNNRTQRDHLPMIGAERVIMISYSRLVLNIAWQHHHTSSSLLDLIQEGTIGLMRAVRRFDRSRGVRFSTYATPWVHQEIIRFFYEHLHTIRIPENVLKLQDRLTKVGKNVSDELSYLFEPLPSTFGLENLHEENAKHTGETIVDREDSSLEEYVFQKQLREKVRKIINTLPSHERVIISRHFGLTPDSIERSIREVVAEEQLPFTRQRAQQYEQKAFAYIRREYPALVDDFLKNR